ncbi:MAG: DUF1573 domain-containing protein [Lentisphaerae bacterium]|jgi:hypothetical protein|nr:DUF1573 domain-containing protein [Lentisphaerota bacterium]MBT4814118.1 DUF1573 domain-containing protein [Lentisphaerota bacterium]MBT5606131.1 DUF1573 domain-containing protein [Lentisphaerota bacterium]MBT7060196.1 DUF1573 domain-containing protein [Lentisphaerota bacterium]MBT7840418.1 DUF1573 domain-containing protein [Lentisphaerota bacterium]
MHGTLHHARLISRAALTLAVAGCVAGLTLRSQTAQAQGTDRARKPEITCDAPTHDFGRAEDRDTIKHEFTIQNAGNAALEVKRISSGCGCSVSRIKSNTIRPGGKTKVTVELSPLGRRGIQQIPIRIESNDPVNPIYQLWFKGTVFGQVDLEPSFVNFRNIPSDQTVRQPVVLISQAKGIKITKAVSHSPKVKITVGDRIDSKRQQLMLETVPPLQIGHFATSVTIHTTHPELSEVELPISVTVMGEVRLLPKELTFPLSAGKPLNRVIFVRPGSAAEFSVESVSGPFTEEQTTLIKQSSGAYRIDLRGIRVTPELAGQVVHIVTDLEKMKDIRVPIKIVP